MLLARAVRASARASGGGRRTVFHGLQTRGAVCGEASQGRALAAVRRRPGQSGDATQQSLRSLLERQMTQSDAMDMELIRETCVEVLEETQAKLHPTFKVREAARDGDVVLAGAVDDDWVRIAFHGRDFVDEAHGNFHIRFAVDVTRGDRGLHFECQTGGLSGVVVNSVRFTGDYSQLGVAPDKEQNGFVFDCADGVVLDAGKRGVLGAMRVYLAAHKVDGNVGEFIKAHACMRELRDRRDFFENAAAFVGC